MSPGSSLPLSRPIAFITWSASCPACCFTCSRSSIRAFISAKNLFLASVASWSSGWNPTLYLVLFKMPEHTRHCFGMTGSMDQSRFIHVSLAFTSTPINGLYWSISWLPSM